MGYQICNTTLVSISLVRCSLVFRLLKCFKQSKSYTSKKIWKLNQYYWILHHNYCFLLKESFENLPNLVSVPCTFLFQGALYYMFLYRWKPSLVLKDSKLTFELVAYPMIILNQYNQCNKIGKNRCEFWFMSSQVRHVMHNYMLKIRLRNILLGRHELSRNF